MKNRGFQFGQRKIRRWGALFLTVLMLVMSSDGSVFSWASGDSADGVNLVQDSEAAPATPASLPELGNKDEETDSADQEATPSEITKKGIPLFNDLFRLKSNLTEVTETEEATEASEGELPANLSEIYVDPQAGDDANDGSEPDKALKTLEAALDKQAENQDLTIILMNTVSWTDGDRTLSGGESEDLTIRRYQDFHGEMFSLSGSASLTLNDITIDGDKDVTGEGNRSLFYLDDNSTLNLGDGAILKDNSVSDASWVRNWGGAVYSRDTDTTINMADGSQITGCEAAVGGAITTCGTFNMTGGVISDNATSEVFDVHEGCGGGVAILYNGSMNMSGGEVSGNSAALNGGGISVGTVNGTMVLKPSNPTLNMTGGTVSDNEAASYGGGIFVQCNCTATVTGGSILDNSAPRSHATSYQGGGIYVNGMSKGSTWAKDYQNGVLYLKNAIITDNSAAYGGAGIASCPTSWLAISLKDGAAVYENDGSEFYSENGSIGAHYGDPLVYISSYMLGGGAYNWEDLSDTRDFTDGFMDRDFNLSEYGGSQEGVILELENHPSEKDIQRAERIASVRIAGNSTGAKGGGIGSNGTVIVGTGKGGILIRKTVIGGTAAKNRSYHFTLTIDGGDLNGTYGDLHFVDGTAAFFLSDGESCYAYGFPDGVNYTLTEEETDGMTSAIQGATGTIRESQLAVADVTNTEQGSVSVSKVWDDSDNKDQIRPESVSVQLLADGEPEGDAVLLNESNGFAYTWTDLPTATADGTEIVYTVQEINVPDGYTVSYSGDAETGFTITNQHTPEVPETTTEEPPTESTVPPTPSEVPDTPSGSHHHDHDDDDDGGSTVRQTTVTESPDTVLESEAASVTASPDRPPEETTEASAEVVRSKTPQTGDESHIGIYAMLTLLSGAAVLFLFLTYRRRKKS